MRALSRLSACIAPFCLSLTAIGGRPAAARAGIPAFTRSPARLYSAGSQLLKVSTDADGITTIAMAAKPVNALGLGLMGEMVAAFRALQTGIEGGTQAVILTSETKGASRLIEASYCFRNMLLKQSTPLGFIIAVFSAGLDLPFLLSLQDNAADKAKFTEYATMLKDLVLAIRTCPVPTVAAVNGAAPAGGTVLMLL